MHLGYRDVGKEIEEGIAARDPAVYIIHQWTSHNGDRMSVRVAPELLTQKVHHWISFSNPPS